MSKGYWINLYRSVSNPDALATYSQLATPAVLNGGGRFLIRGIPTAVYESGVQERSVIIEFDSVEKAIAAYQSAEYQTALKFLKGAVDRDVRFVEGL